MHSPPDLRAELYELGGIVLLQMNLAVDDSLFLGLLVGAEVLYVQVAGDGARLGRWPAGGLPRPQQDALRLVVDVDRVTDACSRRHTCNWVIGLPGQWVIWVIFHVRVTGFIILTRCETRVFLVFEKMPKMQNVHLKC